MRVGLDVDGVMAAIHVPVIERLQEQGYAVRTEDWQSWDMEPLRTLTGGKSITEMLHLMDEAWIHDFVPDQEMGLQGSIEKIREGNHDIHVITKRTPRSHAAVTRWLNDTPYDALTFAGKRESKLEYPIDVLIDDAPRIVEEARRFPNKLVYLVDQAWNREVGALPPNVQRVRGVAEVATILQSGDV